MAKVYGLFFGEHNYSTTLIVDGKVEYAIEDEKLLRVKSCNYLHKSSIKSLERIEQKTGITLADADLIVVSDLTLARRKWKYSSEENELVQNYLQKINTTGKPVKIVTHHQAHAASAYYLSGFKGKTIVVTSDGGSYEHQYGSIWLAENGKISLFKPSSKIDEGSLGNIYGNICNYMGFRGLKDEGKVMGMAPDGHYVPHLYRSFKKLAEYEGNLRFKNGENTTLIHFTLDRMREEGWFDTLEQKKIAAYNLQKAFTDNLVEYIKDIKQHFPDYNKLCLAGGVFANVKSNQHINEECGFDEIFIAPPMGDEGCSLGAAILGSIELGDWEHKPTNDVFFGMDYSDKEIAHEFETWPNLEIDKDHIDYEYLADLLIDRKIVAIYQGKLEFGPRALGNRSVIMETTHPENHAYLNHRFGRNEVMPFAPFSMKEKANEVFHITKSTFAAEFMTLCYTVRDEWAPLIPAVIHKADNTARPQLVTKEKHNFFYNICNAYYKKTGIPVLLNTSFNGHGEPIVDTPAQAFAHLNKGSIDYLVIGGKIYKKK